MGRVYLITGSSGIAAATARRAAAAGHSVFIAGIDEQECRALAVEFGGRYSAGDLARSEAAAAAVESCAREYGRLDGLFNVAGISGRRFGDGPLDECTDEGWDRTLDANLRTVFQVSRAALRVMRNGAGGSIVNMGSTLASSPEPKRFATHAYAASKAAIEGLTVAMASYYAPERIRVNCIAGGLTSTPMSSRAQSDPNIREWIALKQPLTAGMLEPDDIARAALFLLSDDARGITGQVIAVDGGWSVTPV